MEVRTAREVVRTGDLEVDRTPVTNGRYEEFVRDTGHRPPVYWEGGTCPESLLTHPVVGVDFFDALAFARWAGGVLPTEAEWMEATGLGEHRVFVWGDEFDGSMCNTLSSGIKGTTEVGRYPSAPSGCVDLCGNVWEMTCSEYPDDDQAIIVKGGSWYDYPVHAKLEARFSARVHKAGNTVGFRLVYGRAERLPDLVAAELVEECLEWRRARPCNAPDLAGAEEGAFESVIRELREEALGTIPGLGDGPEVDGVAVEEALELFDDLEFSSSEVFAGWEPKANQESEYEPNLFERMQTLVTTYPRSVLAAALSLAVLLLFTALPGGETARSFRARAAGSDGQSAARGAPGAEFVGGGTRGRAGGASRDINDLVEKLTPLENAIESVLGGTPGQREEAERFLIHNAESSRGAVLVAMERSDVSEHAKASFRYVLAGMAEKEPGLRKKPSFTTVPPREGLVYFFDRIDATVSRDIAQVRRTAQAEGLPVTMVYTGTSRADAIARYYPDMLRDVTIYVDRDKTLTKLWGASATPAVAGVRKGGRLVFVHIGGLRRSQLAHKTARIKG